MLLWIRFTQYLVLYCFATCCSCNWLTVSSGHVDVRADHFGHPGSTSTSSKQRISVSSQARSNWAKVYWASKVFLNWPMYGKCAYTPCFSEGVLQLHNSSKFFCSFTGEFFLPHIRMFLPGVTQSGKRIKIVRAVTAAVNCKRKKRKSCLPTTLLRG